MSHSVETETEYGEVLQQLPGLNLQCGPRGLLTTCDPRHIFKRFATLLRGLSGIQVANTTITPEYIVGELSQLPDVSGEKAADLMDPADKMNVPKATALIQKMALIKDNSSTLDQTDAHRITILHFLAQTLNLFLQPFIDPDMSLSDQIFHLATYAHVTYAMYMRHKLAFLTGALYADSHAIVKHIIFNVARLANIDPELLYYALLEGTDRLETVFSHARTYDHNRNFDVLQLVQKLSIAAELSAVFARQSDVDRGHRRRDLHGVEGVDKINITSVNQQNKAVGDVDLPFQWARAKVRASEMLRESLGYESDLYSDLSSPSHDFMRPNGEFYVGSRWAPEDALSEEGHDQSIPALSHSSTAAVPPDPSPPSSPSPNLDIALPFDLAADPTPASANVISTLIDEREENDFAVGLEDHLQSEEETSSRIATFTIDGMKFRKDSVVPSILRSSRARKSTLRPLRAAGVTQAEAMRTHGKKFKIPDANRDTSDRLSSGDLVVALIRLQNGLAMAVLRVTHLSRIDARTKFHLLSIKIEEMADDFQAACQIIALQPHPKGELDKSDGTPLWIWPGEYLSISGAHIRTQKDYLITIPTRRLQFMSYELIESPSPARQSDNSNFSTYVRAISQYDLETAFGSLCDEFNGDSSEFLLELLRIPEAKNTAVLPYRNNQNEQCFYKENPQLLSFASQYTAATPLPCKLCKAITKLSEMRDHVAGHILRWLRGDEDIIVIENEQEIGADPCGWCGLEGCTTVLGKRSPKARTLHSASDCDYHYAEMSWATAKKITAKSPSSNVPVLCQLCSPHKAVWKYNMAYHLITQHSELGTSIQDDRLPAIPVQMWAEIHITRAEEEGLHVQEAATVEWRHRNLMPASSDLEELARDGVDSFQQNQTVLARERADTASTSHRPVKKTRK